MHVHVQIDEKLRDRVVLALRDAAHRAQAFEDVTRGGESSFARECVALVADLNAAPVTAEASR